eukprot:54845-Pleurochrysis_carterae.AAC.2
MVRTSCASINCRHVPEAPCAASFLPRASAIGMDARSGWKGPQKWARVPLARFALRRVTT